MSAMCWRQVGGKTGRFIGFKDHCEKQTSTNGMYPLLRKAIELILSQKRYLIITKIVRRLTSPFVSKDTRNYLYYKANQYIKQNTSEEYHLKTDLNVITLDKSKQNTFFGFYDICPFNEDNNKVLFCRTNINSRPRIKGDMIDLCVYDFDNDSVYHFGQTNTWNWQQSCRLQWLEDFDDKVVYNREVDGNHGAVIQDVVTGDITARFDSPLYDVSTNESIGLSIDFGRLDICQTDYGYLSDKSEGDLIPHPDNDGIHIIGLDSGNKDLLISFEEMAELTGVDKKFIGYVMNLMFSPGGDKFCFLYRYHKQGTRHTQLLVSNISGDRIEILQSDHEASHPTWLDNEKLLCTVNNKSGVKTTDYNIYHVFDGPVDTLTHSLLNIDTHPSPHPNNPSIFVADSYPDEFGNRKLIWYDIKNNKYEELLSIFAFDRGGVKRDLHARWDRNGDYICVDLPKRKNRKQFTLLEIKGSARTND